MENKKLKLIFATLLLALYCSCGIKGPPLPPVETIEDETINAKAVSTTSASGTTAVNPASADKTKTK